MNNSIKILVMIFIPMLAFAAEHKPTETILITASTGGLGNAIAKDLAIKGYKLILTGRDEGKLNALKDSLIKYTKVDTIKLDYSDMETIKLAAANLEDKSIDGIVLIPPRPHFNKMVIPEPNQWRKNFDEIFIGPLEFIRLAQNKMKKLASLVIISGETSKYYMPDYPNTNITRLMWSGEIKNLCHQMSNNGIRVNAVSPGIILTEHNIKKLDDRARMANKSFENQLLYETKDLPSKEYGVPEDVASIVSFLLNDDSKHINCENITISGGSNKSY